MSKLDVHLIRCISGHKPKRHNASAIKRAENIFSALRKNGRQKPFSVLDELTEADK